MSGKAAREKTAFRANMGHNKDFIAETVKPTSCFDALKLVNALHGLQASNLNNSYVLSDTHECF